MNTPHIEAVFAAANLPKKQQYVEVGNGKNQAFNKALRTFSEDKQVEVLKELIGLGEQCQNSSDEERLRACELMSKVLGFEVKFIPRLSFTLARQGVQFRCWTETPRYVRSEHVDSGGSGLLFHLSGEPERVQACIEALLTVDQRRNAISLPNGCVLYDVVIWRN
ncbi:MAG: hypothetical protein WCO52_04765 [bacterium]